jgi:hypothetical protein
MLLTKSSIKLLMAVFVSGIILMSFHALNQSTSEILVNASDYIPHSNNIEKYEKLNFTLVTYVKTDAYIQQVEQTFSNFTNESAYGMYDYTNNRNIDKMHLWQFFACLMCLFSGIMSIYCYFSNRKKEIIQVLTFNNLVLVILFIMYIVNFEKFYYEIYNQYTNEKISILINIIGVHI